MATRTPRGGGAAGAAPAQRERRGGRGVGARWHRTFFTISRVRPGIHVFNFSNYVTNSAFFKDDDAAAMQVVRHALVVLSGGGARDEPDEEAGPGDADDGDAESDVDMVDEPECVLMLRRPMADESLFEHVDLTTTNSSSGGEELLFHTPERVEQI